VNQTCILVPVYNHPGSLPWLVSGLQALGLQTLLVNDGSDQGCTDLLREIDADQDWVTLIERETNGGKGAAVKTGLMEAARLGYSHVMQLDADGQHDLGDIPRFLDLSERYPNAMISGAPDYTDVPMLRLYARYLTHIWVWINTLSLDIKDSMCGFRVYPLEATIKVIERAHVGDRMDFDPEILVRLHWDGVRIIQIRTLVTYPLDGVSHFRGFRDNMLISWAHTRLFFGMLARLPGLLSRSRPTHD
jgi:glycosyltransferase involved in cell wall biosynthesis